MGPRAAKMAEENHQLLYSTKKLQLPKPLKIQRFLVVFGIEGHPRQPRNAQEGSQEALEEPAASFRVIWPKKRNRVLQKSP